MPPTITNIDAIIERRRRQPLWVPELWDFAERVEGVPREKLNDQSVQPRPLEHLKDTALQARLENIERNIQYLDGGAGEFDAKRPEDGWLSPWWWLRLRHWTLSEFARRDLGPLPTRPIPSMPRLRPDFLGIHAGRSPKLFRISRVPYLMSTLERGQLRFAPAKGYKALEADAARGDDEMKKGYRRSGRMVSITTLDGHPIEALTEVSFDTARMTPDMVDLPYWMLCASTDLDPRLIPEFSEGQADDAVLAIFDTEEFRKRAGPPIAAAAPHAIVHIAPVTYYDVYHPPGGDIPPVIMKEMRFAYQRELRLVLDPGRGLPFAEGPVCVDIGSIEDIAAVYGSEGRRIAGNGPDSFLA
jgi:hypothetical protein